MRKLRGEGQKVINVKLTTEGKLMRNEVMEATGKAGVQWGTILQVRTGRVSCHKGDQVTKGRKGTMIRKNKEEK